MKLAIIGSRTIEQITIENYLPKGVTEIVSGGARGVDSLAKKLAIQKGIPFVEFLPKYNLYGKAAPIKRNKEIAEYADQVLVFWDEKSKGTESTINFFKKLGKDVLIITV